MRRHGRPWTHGTVVGMGDHNHHDQAYTIQLTTNMAEESHTTGDTSNPHQSPADIYLTVPNNKTVTHKNQIH